MRAICQPGPVVPVNIAGGERPLKVAPADVGQDRLGGSGLDGVVRAIDAPGMAFEVMGKGQGLKQGLVRNLSVAGSAM